MNIINWLIWALLFSLINYDLCMFSSLVYLNLIFLVYLNSIFLVYLYLIFLVYLNLIFLVYLNLIFLVYLDIILLSMSLLIVCWVNLRFKSCTSASGLFSWSPTDLEDKSLKRERERMREREREWARRDFLGEAKRITRAICVIVITNITIRNGINNYNSCNPSYSYYEYNYKK